MKHAGSWSHLCYSSCKQLSPYQPLFILPLERGPDMKILFFPVIEMKYPDMSWGHVATYSSTVHAAPSNNI